MTPETDPRTAALLENTRWLRALARRLVGASEADDLVQEVLVAGWGAPHVPASALRNWLASVARRLASTRHRITGARSAREQAVARSEAVPPPTALEQAELQRVLLDAVLALDEPYRATVLARFVEGLEVDAIADREGVAASSIRSRLARAYEPLRRRLDREFGGRERWALLLAPAATPALVLGPMGLVTGLLVTAGLLALGLLTLRSTGSDARRADLAAAPGLTGTDLRDVPREPSSTAREPLASDVELEAPEPGPRTVWDGPWRLTGTVHDESGPVAGASVLWTDLSDAIVLDRIVTTDASGRFLVRFADEAQARSAVLVTARKGDLSARPDRPGPFQDGIATVDLQLPSTLTTLVLVRDDQGLPLENVELSIGPGLDLACQTDTSGDETRAWRRALRGSKSAHGRTDARGECRLVTPTLLVEGRLGAWKEGYRLVTQERFAVDPVRAEAQASWHERTREMAREVRDGQRVSIPLEPPVAPRQDLLVTTLVLERGTPLIVRLLDAQGAPVPGAAVRAGDFSVRVTHASDARGRVELPEFPPARRNLQIEADAPGFAPLKVMASGNDPRWNDADELVLTLARPTSIGLRLTDEAGTPIPGSARLKADDPLAERLGTLEDPIAIGADGRVHWNDVPDTAGDLWVLVPGFEPAFLPWVARARGVGTGERLVLAPARTWIVEVVAAESGEPIQDATLDVSFEFVAAGGRPVKKSFQRRAPRERNRIPFDSSSLLDAGGTRPVRCRFRVSEGSRAESWTLSSPDLRAEPGVRVVRLERGPERPAPSLGQD